jgi:C-terminal processing protease CtpA/Prc
VLIGSTVYPSFSNYSTEFDVPGGAMVHFGGARVRWPDGRLLKDGGVQPDIEVVPTVAGLREGRDEVLDRAVAFLSQ